MGSVIDIAFHQGDLIVLLRLLIAALAGAVIGWNRFRAGKPAGVGTHALVALGSALFVLIAIQMSPGHSDDAFTRVVQGIATGVGFLGAGEIFRDAGTSSRVHGLTSAAALWVTAALGIVAGCGSGVLIASATALVLLVIVLSPRLERRFPSKAREER
jgi:putative Mg2+ transporter-C (MgtC) family protein